MKAWLRDLWAAARLRTSAFESMAARSDAFLQGFLVIVAVALIAGLPAMILDLVGNLQSQEPVELAAVSSSARQALANALPELERLGVGSDIQEQMAEGFDAAVAIGAGVAGLPTSLPRPFGAIFAAVGGWLSRPFGSGFPLAAAALGTWLGYGIWVMLSARLLGGQGAMHGFFGATALFALPHLLGVFSRVPVAGPIFGWIAFLWGLAIYVKATAASHKLPLGWALLAVALPALLCLLLLILLLPVVAGAIMILLAELGA